MKAERNARMEVCLVMFREDGSRVEFALTKPVTIIGRKETCDIRIPLAEVSRKHTEVLVDDASVKVKDAGSANGTYVNNKRVAEEKLAPGDHLIVGPVVFTVQVDGDPSDIRPVRTKLRRRGSSAAPQPVAASASGSAAALDDDQDPISALEALASSAEQTAIDPLDDDDLLG
jgi:pSer/pThr/pTyr-binding forkhead associated (FHA) protein